MFTNIPNITLCVAAMMWRLPASENKASLPEDEKVGLGCTKRSCLNQIKKK